MTHFLFVPRLEWRGWGVARIMWDASRTHGGLPQGRWQTQGCGSVHFILSSSQGTWRGQPGVGGWKLKHRCEVAPASHPWHELAGWGMDVLKRGILWILRKDRYAEWFQHSEECHQGHQDSCVTWGLPEQWLRRSSCGVCPVTSWSGGCHPGTGLPEGAATSFSKPSSTSPGLPWWLRW